MDERYMKHALSLAKRGIGKTRSNPLVGAVLVKEGRIIGEGWHRAFGAHHAEVDCLNRAEEDPRGATMYVNLEPCSHYGKTPPCAKTLIKAGVARVVVGTLDPNPKVAGRGVSVLKLAGIEVTVGVLEADCLAVNRPFFTSILNRRPYVTAKYAVTLDGKIATKTGESQWITGSEARKDGHRLRGEVDAIMVGTGTVLADDPRLSNRSGEGGQPLRVILDRRGVISEKARVYDGSQATVVYTAHMDEALEHQLSERGVVVRRLKEERGHLPLDEILRDLYEEEAVGHLLVEGGGRLHGSFIEHDFVDAFALYLAPSLFGGGKEAVAGEGIAHLNERRDYEITEILRLGDDLSIRGVRRCLRES